MENKKLTTSFGFSVAKEKLELVKKYEMEFDAICKNSKKAFFAEDKKWMDELEIEYENLHEMLNMDFAAEIEENGEYFIPSLYWEK